MRRHGSAPIGNRLRVDTRQVGVEEELLLVDPTTRRLSARQRHARAQQHEGGAPVEGELYLQQVETQTPPTRSLTELTDQVRAGRRALGEAAREAGAAAVAVGTPILVEDAAADAAIAPDDRYQRIRQTYGELAHTATACAMHVHVDVADPAEGVRVIDGIAPWLPLLLAASVNSPYAAGRDTGHASWRSQLWARWPSHGSHQHFGDVAAYEGVRDHLVAWGAALDEGMLYLDARLGVGTPTVEIRVADVCAEVDDAVVVAALARALTETAAAAAPQPAWRGDLLRAATWRAARHGLADSLVDPLTLELTTARAALTTLLEHVEPALAAAGDTDTVTEGVERLLARGTGAARQRAAYEAGGSLEAVVDDAVRRTEASWA